MGEFIKAANKQDLAPGTGVVSEVKGVPIAIFNVDGSFYAIHNTCVHKGGPLGEGELNGTVVTCPWHGWEYDVTTGCNPENDKVRVQKFNLKVEGDDVLVELS